MEQIKVLNSHNCNDFEIEHIRRTGFFNMSARHFHDNYEIYYLLSGEICYFIKDETYHIKPGVLVFINKNDLHKTSNIGPSMHERILINFKKEFVSDILSGIKDSNLLSLFENGPNTIIFDDLDKPFVENILFRMLQERKNMQEEYMTILRILLLDLLVFIKRSNSRNKAKAVIYSNFLHDKISEIAKHINLNYMKDISLKQLSKEFYISRYYLSRAFKEITGISFTQYLNYVRIKEAQKFLMDPGSSITVVSEKAGYQSATHFGRVFKHITGMSPMKYRKNNCTT